MSYTVGAIKKPYPCKLIAIQRYLDISVSTRAKLVYVRRLLKPMVFSLQFWLALQLHLQAVFRS